MRNKFLLLAAVAGIATGFALLSGISTAAMNFPDPPKAALQPASGKATAVLAGGCFWGMQGIYEHMKGVVETTVGYSGGKANTAKYTIVEQGDTGHAESIRIVYDPSKISYGDLLKVYFSVAHDPTTLNRQHYDTGPQYRSSIFYANDEQKATAEQYIAQLNAAHVFKDPIVTKVVPLDAFYPGEGYHQHYLDQVVACDAKPTFACAELNSGYIKGVDVPLLRNFEQKYPELYVKESR
jgi:peptide-methionine (S)-S-oxide reductase